MPLEPETSKTPKAVPGPSLKRFRLEMGVLGTLFGSRSQAAYNIAGIVIFSAFVLLGIVLFVDRSLFLPLTEALSTLVALALGYLFGRRGQ